jgi:hypothetical protein
MAYFYAMFSYFMCRDWQNPQKIGQDSWSVDQVSLTWDFLNTNIGVLTTEPQAVKWFRIWTEMKYNSNSGQDRKHCPNIL